MAKERYVFELPEKVYIDDFGSGFSHGWHTEHSYEKDIEYVRKDTFIDKACEWIKYNKENGGCLFDGWEEDFKKYIEE